jgi:hypothetical protein
MSVAYQVMYCLRLTPWERREPPAPLVDLSEGPRAKPGATLLMLAFAPRRGPGPKGIDPARIPTLFPHWDLTSSRPASEITLNGPVRSAWATWYRLTRQ